MKELRFFVSNNIHVLGKYYLIISFYHTQSVVIADCLLINNSKKLLFKTYYLSIPTNTSFDEKTLNIFQNTLISIMEGEIFHLYIYPKISNDKNTLDYNGINFEKIKEENLFFIVYQFRELFHQLINNNKINNNFNEKLGKLLNEYYNWDIEEKK